MKIFIVLFFLINNSCSLLIRYKITNFYTNSNKKLSLKARNLVNKSFKNINLSKLEDFHFHAVFVPEKNNKVWLSPRLKSLLYPKSYLKYKIYLSALGARDFSKNINQQIVNRLLFLVRQDPRYGKIRFLAFDYNYSLNGKKDLKNSTFYIPNNYVWKLYKKYPKIIIPVMSIHPYKKNALKELHYWGKKGIKMIKWLPNAQNINPSLPRLNAYYNLLKKYNIVLLTHTGEEKAVRATNFQRLGNPLLLQRPLNLKVKVIMAHFASAGKCKNLNTKKQEIKSCFLFAAELLKNPKYKNNLFVDISAISLFNHIGPAVDFLLNNKKYHHRFVNGSDYPLPAIRTLFNLNKLVKLKYLEKDKVKLLDEIYKYNPLLFDFVLKRNLISPKLRNQFLPITFEVPDALK